MLLSLLGSFLLSCPFTRLRLHLAVELLHPQGSLCLASVSQQPLLSALSTAGASLAGWRAQLQLSNFCDDAPPLLDCGHSEGRGLNTYLRVCSCQQAPETTKGEK